MKVILILAILSLVACSPKYIPSNVDHVYIRFSPETNKKGKIILKPDSTWITYKDTLK